ncbi:hypothetical protein TUE45_pSRTUE45c_0240 (plasmid) [Streptomyces reticuli]|nr:hypothetical protein TUE45_pSRTUE45c_0240 [Streptomyces reticuli]
MTDTWSSVLVLARHTPVVLLDGTSPPAPSTRATPSKSSTSSARSPPPAAPSCWSCTALTAAGHCADTVVALKDGRVTAQGPPRDTVEAALVQDLYGLDADIPHAPGDAAGPSPRERVSVG